jgi:hypothetical protein
MVEVYNQTAGPVDATGYVLQDEDLQLDYTVPQLGGADIVLQPGGRIVLSIGGYFPDFQAGTTFYLFTGGVNPDGTLPNWLGGPGDADPADQVVLHDRSMGVVDYVGWSGTPTPSVDFLGVPRPRRRGEPRDERGDRGREPGPEAVEALSTALERSRSGPDGLDAELHAIRQELHAIDEALAGNRARASVEDYGRPTITRRVQVAQIGTAFSTYGPTPTHRRSLEIAEAELAGVRERLNAVLGQRLPAFERKLEQAGAPWTPVRPVPPLP